MTINDWLTATTATFQTVGIETGRLDALILLEDAIGRERAYLLAQPETVLDKAITDQLEPLVGRRCSHEPMAYIRGKTEFYGLEFTINELVLIPRPETETMIDLLKAHASGAQTIIDVGTGSGVLAITAKRELTSTRVIATDIDEHCLNLARENAEKLVADVEFVESDLLDVVPADAYTNAVVLANLPYVPDDYEINRAAAHEPTLAIFGGYDGLELYRQLFGQLKRLDTKPVFVFTEALPAQHDSLKAIAYEHGYTQIDAKDFIQVFRL